MLRRIAIFVGLALGTAVLMYALLGRRAGDRTAAPEPVELAIAPGDSAGSRAGEPAAPATPAVVPLAPPAKAAPAPVAPLDDGGSATEEMLDPALLDPILQIDPREAALLAKYGGHSHAELSAAEEALERDVRAEEKRHLRERIARGAFLVVRPGDAPPAIPLGPNGELPQMETSTVTDANGDTQAQIAWLPFEEYPDFYSRLSELLWLQAQLEGGDE